MRLKRGTPGKRSGTIRLGNKVRQQATKKANEKGARQKKQAPAGASGQRDAAPSRRKNPATVNATSSGEQQQTAQAGDTVPLLFCKQVTIGSVKYGGTWVQPDLLKQSSFNFTDVLLFAISQGNIATTPSTQKAYIGGVSLPFIPNASTPSLTQYYKSDSQMAAAKNVCPITSGKIFCDIETASYTNTFINPQGWIGRDPPDVGSTYWQVSKLMTRGEGDTTNTIMNFPGTTILVKEIATGIDRTSNFWTLTGNDPANVVFKYNTRLDGSGNIIGGRAVGTAVGSGAFVNLSLIPNWYAALFGTNEPCVIIYAAGTVDKQVNASNPASTGELYGVEYEYSTSSVANPASFPSSYDFTAFSDITFLELQGNVRDGFSGGRPKRTSRQLAIFYESGADVVLYSEGSTSTGPSNKFVDLAMHLFFLIKRANPGNASISQPINTVNLQTLATFSQNIKAFFNGSIDQSVNVLEYITVMSPFFLLSFVSENGRYSLQPLLPLSGGNISTSALTPSATFTEANILPGSFSKVYFDQSQRRDFNVSVILRQATAQEIGGQRTRIVRFTGTSSDAPTEQFDMTDFCTNSEHADIFAKYELARRKHSTHSISFDAPLLTTGLIPTQIIKVQRQRINSTGDDRTEVEWYQVTNVEHASDGVTSISATHFPVNGSNVSLISNEIVNTTFEVA